MSAIFLSHSSADDGIAAEVKAWLAGLGHRSVFLDFDPEAGIPAGRDWERELYRQLRACRAVLVLASERSMSSRWVFAEITHARALGKHIFPVKVGACDLDSILTDSQVVDLTADREEAYRRLARGLRAAGIDAADPFDWDASRSPYPGLLAFEEQDAAIFFGRDDEIGAALDSLNQVRWQGGTPMLLLLGASGSGKSSLLKAGMLPRLRRDPERWLVVGPMRPGESPYSELAGALGRAFREAGAARGWREIRDALDPGAEVPASAAAPAEALAGLAADLVHSGGHGGCRVLVVIDQFEELLGRSPGHPSHRFLAALRGAFERPDNLVVVLGTMRSDFLGVFQKSPALRGLDFRSLAVGPMPVEGLVQVIERPAALAGLEVESGLTQAILDDADTDDALPLVAFALRQLWTAHGGDGVLRVRDYRDRLGGLQGAIAKAAERVIGERRLRDREEEELRRAFLAMVRLTEDGQYTRRPVEWRQLPGDVHPVLDRFVRARLQVTRGDGEEATVEVAHEALFRAWHRLAGWLEENRGDLVLQSELRQAARLWEQAERAADYLWRKGRLHRAVELRDEGRLHLEPQELSFLSASEEAERREIRARRRRRRLVLGATLLVAVVMSVLTVFALHAQRREAEARRRSVEQGARVLAIEARTGLAHRLDLALLLALEASRLADGYESRTALVTLLASSPRLETYLDGHRQLIWSLAFSPDGSHLASASQDGTVRLWDPLTRRTERVIDPRAGRVLDAAFSPGGDILATAHDDGDVRFWDVETGRAGPVFAGDTRVVDLDFSPDGRYLVCAYDTGALGLWELATGELVTHSLEPGAGPGPADVAGPWLEGHDAWVWSVFFDPSGSRLASGSVDGSVRVWDVATGRRIATLESEEKGTVFSLAYDREGTLAVGWQTGAVTVYAPGAETPEIELPAHGDEIRGLAFSPDGKVLASASNDGLVRGWEVASGALLFELPQHAGGALDVAYAPAGELLATAAGDGTLRLWNVDPRQPGLELAGHSGRLTSAAVSADGRRAASGGIGGGVLVWDLASGERLRDLGDHGSEVHSLDFSPDGRLLAAASGNGLLRLWEVETGELRARLEHDGWLWRARFSWDGRRVATAADDGTVRVWNAATNAEEWKVEDPETRQAVGLAFSPDGRRLAVGNVAGVVKLLDASTGTELSEIPDAHAGLVSDLAFSRDAPLLVSVGYDEAVRVWNSESGELVRELSGHEEWIETVAVSADGTRVISGDRDGVLRVWDLAGGEDFGLLGHRGIVLAARVLPEGRVVSAATDLAVRQWRTDVLETAREEACRKANRNLRVEEWNKYLGRHLDYRLTCSDLPADPAATRPPAPSQDAGGERPERSEDTTPGVLVLGLLLFAASLGGGLSALALHQLFSSRRRNG